jgi:hypothetical protein
MNTIWAEDGLIFYSQALTHSFGQTLTTAYGGYFQLFPRLAVQIVRLFPVRDAAATIAILGAMSVSALALIIFHAARGHIASPAARCVLVGSMVLLPVANAELLDNLVNVLWWLFFVTFWMLLWRPRTWSGSILAAVVCLLATGSDPTVALFLPLVIIRMIVVRGVRENFVVVGFAAGLFYQVLGTLAWGTPNAPADTSLHGIASLFALRVGLGSFTGTRGTNLIISSHDGAWVGLGLLLIVVVLAVACFRREAKVILFVSTSLVFSFLSFAVPIGYRGAARVMINAPAQLGSRYVAVPILLVLGAVIAEADHFHIRNLRPRANLGIVVCCLVLIPCWIVDLRTPNGRSTGPGWSSQVARATATCRSKQDGVPDLATAPVGWATPVPCVDLR